MPTCKQSTNETKYRALLDLDTLFLVAVKRDPHATPFPDFSQLARTAFIAMLEWDKDYFRIPKVKMTIVLCANTRVAPKISRPDRKTWPELWGMTSATDS